MYIILNQDSEIFLLYNYYNNSSPALHKARALTASFSHETYILPNVGTSYGSI